jgi:hypothetical protein
MRTFGPFPRQVELLRSSLGVHLRPNLAVVPLTNDSWAAPALAGPKADWHSRMPHEYRLMGDWRLGPMPEFARRMGHKCGSGGGRAVQ